MPWNKQYLPPDPTLWRGHADMPAGSCFFQLIELIDLLDAHLPLNLNQPAFGIVGFRCDEGIRRQGGRVGAAEGSSAIRQSLAKLPILKKGFRCFDVGNIACLDGDLEASQTALSDIIAYLLNHHIHPIVLGGGHELSWGHYQGIDKAFPNKSLGIINFDSHFDMNPLSSHEKSHAANPFLQIAEAHRTNKNRFDYNCIGIQPASNIQSLVDIAKSYQTHIIWADELHLGQMNKCMDFIDRIIDQNDMIYLSLSLDVFSAATAPGVSAIQPLGLSPWHIIPLIRQLASSGKVMGYDIAGMSPRYDIDHCTAKLAAHLVYEFTHHHSEAFKAW